MDILTAINFLHFFSTQTFLDTISYAQVQKLNIALFQDSFTCVTNTLVDPTVGKKIKTLQTNYQNIHGDFGLFYKLLMLYHFGNKVHCKSKGTLTACFIYKLNLVFGLPFHHLSVKGPIDFSLHLSTMPNDILQNWTKNQTNIFFFHSTDWMNCNFT